MSHEPDSAADATVQCPLCGASFDTRGKGCRGGCPMSGGCKVYCCPTCGYSFPEEAGLAARLRRLLRRVRARRAAARQETP